MAYNRVQSCKNSATTVVNTDGQTVTLQATFASPCTGGNMIVCYVGVHIIGFDFAYRCNTPQVKIDGTSNIFTQSTWNDGVYLGGGSSGVFFIQVPSSGSVTVDFTFTARIDPIPKNGTFDYSMICIECSGIGNPSTESAQNDPIFGVAGNTPVTLTLSDTKSQSVPVTFTGSGGTAGGPGTDISISVVDIASGGILQTDALFACIMESSATTALLPTTSNTSYTGFSLVDTAVSTNSILYAWDGAVSGPIQAWLVVDEPPSGSPPVGGGWTDRSHYLYTGEGTQHSFSLQARQRGSATYTLQIDASDSYAPTLWQTILLYDQTPAGFTLMFSGVIQSYKIRQQGTQGYRLVDVSAVSFEAIFDQVLVTTPVHFENADCGTIFTTLFNDFESGCQLTLGTVQAGSTLPIFNAQVGDKLSDIFNQLATTSQFTWNVNPATLQVFFGVPTATAAPFSITSALSQWESITYEQNGADERNRQLERLSFDAFPHSMEYFQGSGQQSFTLMRPVKQVTNAYVTLSTPNTATCSFSGQPADGDTVTIGPVSGTWQATHVYALGGVIVVNGYVQKVTTNGTSGGSIPAFSTITGATTTDNSVIWTCQGPLGLGTGASTFTFKVMIDNTQYGQVLIGSSVAATVQNLADAINANASVRGTTFSLPTWEQSQVNAITITGTGFTVQQKAAGSGWVASLTSTGSAFAWSAAQTSGGTSPQGSVGPNQGATITIQVYQQGTSTAAPGLAYKEGSTVVTLATPLNSGTNLNVEYTRADGDVIQCERTDLVAALAVTTRGTGKIQQISDSSTLGLTNTDAATGLLLCQEILALYDTAPQSIEVEIIKPGLYPVMDLTLALSGYWSLLNGSWYIEEVRGEFIPFSGNKPGGPYVDQSQCPGGGHYRYTLNLINVTQIGSALDWWLGTSGSGGSGGGSQAGSLVATSGGASGTSGNSSASAGVNNQTGTSYAFQTTDQAKLVTFSNGSSIAATIAQAGSSSGFVNGWFCWVENRGAGSLTITPTTSTIDGASSLVLGTNQGIGIFSDGTNYYTANRGAGLVNPMTTKGDIIVAGASGVAARLGVGSDGKVLTANSGATDGVDWEAPIALTTTGTSGAATLTPGNPYAINIPQYSSGTWVEEVPSGTLNGTNTAFTISFTPISGSLTLFLNVVQREGTDFSISGSTITFTVAPKARDTGWFQARYQH